MSLMYTHAYQKQLQQDKFKDLFYLVLPSYDVLSYAGTYILYLEQFPTTCSTVYCGNISEYLYYSDRYPDRIPVLTDFIKRYIFVLSGYTEVIVTVRDEYVETLQNMGFELLGDSFINKRTEHRLQHLHYMRKD